MNNLIKFLFLLCFFNISFAQEITETFLTQSILQRVLFIKNIGTGSSFVIEKNNKSYIVTAKHLFPNIKENDSVKFEIMQDKMWKKNSGIAHLHSNTNVDALVIDLGYQIFGNNQTNFLENQGLMPLASEGYFLGFPLSLKSEMPKNGNNGLPIPLIKKVIWSGTVEVNGITTQVLDGNNTPGFSGGPVFIKCYNNGKIAWNLIGLVTGYFLQNNTIHLQQGDLNYNENSGIISCVDILYIKEIFKSLK